MNSLKEKESLSGISEKDPLSLKNESPYEDHALDYPVAEMTQNRSIVMAAVGDIMVHSPQLNSAFHES